ncbi:sulfite exporter TauE/SafE family protein [Treponema pedis]|uniref:sulfite exporter TauE/SafE family protein n=1 Tax=Treponema pedis TaxID=409322 RepID=UPI003133F813
MQLTIWSAFILYFCVFLAGLVDSAAGGGGLISLPAYLFTGLNTHTAIGCNKFSAACGTGFSAMRFFKNGALDWKIAFISAICSFISSFIGIKIAFKINPEVLKTVLIIILPVVAAALLLKKNFGVENKVEEISKAKAFRFAAYTGLAVGFYDGLIGPGTGTIAIIVFSACMKYDLKTASGNAKILNLASNYASLIVAVLNGSVIYRIAIPAAICGIMGNYLGAGLALKKGAAFIRPLMVIVICLLFAKLFYDLFARYFLGG